MPGLMQNLIVAAIADPVTHTVRLAWQNGCVTQADFASLLGRGLFTAFHDPAFFGQAEVVDGGRALSWPGELEFDADALWFEAHPEDNPLAGETRVAHLHQ
jgi:hypothetical protein